MSLSPLYGFFCRSEFKGRITTPGFTLCDPSFPSRFLVCFSGLCGACLRQQLLLHLQLILTSISHPLPSMDWPPSAVLFVSSRAGSAWVGLVACVSALQRSLWCQGWWGCSPRRVESGRPPGDFDLLYYQVLFKTTLSSPSCRLDSKVTLLQPCWASCCFPQCPPPSGDCICCSV